MTTKPKRWNGPEPSDPEPKKPKAKPLPKALAEPAEKIPDEIEVFDEQRAIDAGA